MPNAQQPEGAAVVIDRCTMSGDGPGFTGAVAGGSDAIKPNAAGIGSAGPQTVPFLP